MSNTRIKTVTTQVRRRDQTVTTEHGSTSLEPKVVRTTTTSKEGARGRDGETGGVTAKEVNEIITNHELLDGLVNGASPLDYYNLAKG